MLHKVVGLFLFIIVFLSSFPAWSGDYHIKGSNLYCSDCHTLHFSQDGQIPEEPRAWGTEPQDHLLKDVASQMCLMCHDGEDFFAPDVFHVAPRLSSAGYFGYDPNQEACGHTLNSRKAPPGFRGHWTETLACTSCHNPHGNIYYRNLREKLGAESEIFLVTYYTGEIFGNDEDKIIQQLSSDPHSYEVHYDPSNIVYRQEGTRGDQAGLSLWCVGCHTDFHQDATGSNAGQAFKLHPTYGITMGEAADHQRVVPMGIWSSLASRPPMVTPLDGNHSLDRPFCGSCHKAHGSSAQYGLLFEDATTTQREDGRFMRQTCQACHNIGGGFYESSPHGNPDYGVKRTPGFTRGECEHCHQQHGQDGLNDHNLFASNNNSLCLTVGCHLEEPRSYPLSNDKLLSIDKVPSGAKARISMVLSNGKDYRGYFEANDGQSHRLGGLDLRGRWPGKSVYENTPFSPHAGSTMPENGSCRNCHSPHGTENSFDMLKAPYCGTVGSGDFSGDPNNYQLCFNCHSEDGPWAPAGMRPETKRIASYYNQSLNDDKYSGHQLNSETGFAKKGDKLACSNCHNPHGSRGYNRQPNLHLLSDERDRWDGIGDTLTDPNSSRRFCFGCHVPSDKTSAEWENPVVEGIAMRPIAAFSAHEFGSKESCHSCHGRDYSSNTSENVHHPSAGSCNGCHADQGIMAVEEGQASSLYTGPHAYHTDIDGSSPRPRKYAFACEICHAKLNQNLSKTTHGNGRAADLDPNAALGQYAEVSFYGESGEWSSQSIHDRTYRYRSLYHNPYLNNALVSPGYSSQGYNNYLSDRFNPEITWSDQSLFVRNSCSSIWCHSNANPLSLSDDPTDPEYRENSYQANFSFKLTWDDHQGDRCDNCHGFTEIEDPSGSQWYLSSLHRKHIGSAGQEKIACGQCHAQTCEEKLNVLLRKDDWPKDGYFYHVNGQKDIVFAKGTTPNGVYNWANHTCSNLYCHPVEVSWQVQPENKCASCHEVYAFNQETKTIDTGGHLVHLSAARGPHLVCNDCHQSPSYTEAEIDQSRSTQTMLAAKENPNWVTEMWKGSIVVIIEEATVIPVARLITGNNQDTLFLAEGLDHKPLGKFSILSAGKFTHANGSVTFKDSLTLEKTRVCNSCHSPAGNYDGFNDQDIGAKNNWKEGVYEQERLSEYKILKKGKEKWCLGCHDKQPSTSRSEGIGVYAPNIAGDETLSTFYGKGYGYFITGHGLGKNNNYPGSQESGAGLSCTDCHDVSLPHIDHIHRTYSAAKNNYQLGYRLQRVEGQEPMDIPRTWTDGVPDNAANDNPLQDWPDFALCFACHKRGEILGDAGLSDDYYQNPIKTNFYDNSYTKLVGNEQQPVNLHTTHLEGRFRGKNLDWASSWGNVADSSISCPACHNVHGSPSPRMMRHGELISTPGTIDKLPGLNFSYLPSPPRNVSLDNSTGGEIFSHIKAGPGTIANNKICNTCHQAWCNYSRTPLTLARILKAEAWNFSLGGAGIEDQDQLIITFSTATNGQEVTINSQDVQAVFQVWRDDQQMSWGNGIESFEWSNAGGHGADTFTITLRSDPLLTIAPGDLIRVGGSDLKVLKDMGTGRFIESSKAITGTFDCSLISALAEDKVGQAGIQEGDQVVIEFLGSTSGKVINSENINQALQLSNAHSWLNKSNQIQGSTWNSVGGVNDTLTIFLAGGTEPTISIGDRITLGGLIEDDQGNSIFGSVFLEGSFDPLIWQWPEGIYDFSGQGPPGSLAINSIDRDPNTFWHPGGPFNGWIIFDLAAEYRVSQVCITSGNIYDSKGVMITDLEAWVTVWVSNDQGINDPAFSDLPALTQWKVPIKKGPHESQIIEPAQNGRYLKIFAEKKFANGKFAGGPLIPFFCEIQFKGLAPPSPPR